jgi:hypothetical protein
LWGLISNGAGMTARTMRCSEQIETGAPVLTIFQRAEDIEHIEDWRGERSPQLGYRKYPNGSRCPTARTIGIKSKSYRLLEKGLVFALEE